MDQVRCRCHRIPALGVEPILPAGIPRMRLIQQVLLDGPAVVCHIECLSSTRSRRRTLWLSLMCSPTIGHKWGPDDPT